MEQPLHVVLGATGGAGNAIVHALVDRGHKVRAVSRGGNAEVPGGVDIVSADIRERTSAAAGVLGADIVYMAAQPSYHRWAEEFPSMLATVIDAVAAENARLIMVDNLYMYAPSSRPLTETSPANIATRKGKVRIQLAAMLRDAAESRDLAVTIGQASDYFGPGPNMSAITALAISPAVDGKSIKWLGKLDKRHSVAYLPDIARAYAILGESDAAIGTWILPHGPAPTGAEFLATVNRTLPAPAKTGAISKSMLRMAAPFNKVSRESLEIAYQWTNDFVVDDSKFQDVFGPFSSTPLDEAVRNTIDAFPGSGVMSANMLAELTPEPVVDTRPAEHQRTIGG